MNRVNHKVVTGSLVFVASGDFFAAIVSAAGSLVTEYLVSFGALVVALLVSPL